MTKEQRRSRYGHLTLTNNKSEIELTELNEADLQKVVGGSDFNEVRTFISLAANGEKIAR